MLEPITVSGAFKYIEGIYMRMWTVHVCKYRHGDFSGLV
jgi:hypothetical protein